MEEKLSYQNKMWSKIVEFVARDELAMNDFAKEENLVLSTAALFVHMAVVDGEFHEKEYREIKEFLVDRFGFDADMIEHLIVHANRTHNEIMDVDRFIAVINTHMNEEERYELAKMIWYVVLADGKIRACEDRLYGELLPRLGISVSKIQALKVQAAREFARFEDPIRKFLVHQAANGNDDDE